MLYNRAQKYSGGKTGYVKEELAREINLAIEAGYTKFISGMADGVDLYFAEIVAEAQNVYPDITLKAALTHRKRLESKNPTFQRLIKQCDSVHVTAEIYGRGAYLNKNMYMIGKSGLVIAVYAESTNLTLHYAQRRGREIHIIPV